MSFQVPAPVEKDAVWTAYREGRPTRVPLRWNVNSRIVVLNPDLNPAGYTYREAFHDPKIALTVQARFQEYTATTLSQTCDLWGRLPDTWAFCVENQNIYDAAYFGADVHFHDGQVPCTHQFLGLDDVDDFLERDFSRPLDNPWIQDRLAFRERMVRQADSFEYLGRKGAVAPFGVGFDGPVTVAANIFGADIFLLLAMDPPKAHKLFMTIARAALIRNQALADLAGGFKKTDWGGAADDSIQLISTGMYEEVVMPVHEFWYGSTSNTRPEDGRRSIHLCGDATRHFPLIARRLGVTSFDTGFPVDHGRLRHELGADVEISGGPEVALLKSNTPDACANRARNILESGVMEGGRFVMQEANNLPPCVPLENLRAVYRACLEYGRYDP